MTIPAGFAELTYIFQYSGAPRVSTFALGVDPSGFAELDDPVAIAGAGRMAAVNSIGPFPAGGMMGHWQFLGVSCTLETESGPIVGQDLTTITGSASGSEMPINCTLLVNKVTAAGGRRNRGRMFVPPVWPQESKVDGLGIIDTDQIPTGQSRYDDFYTSLTEAPLLPVLFHQSGSVVPTAITSFAVQGKIATQRRRMRR